MSRKRYSAAFRGRVPPYRQIPCGSGIERFIGGLSRLDSGISSADMHWVGTAGTPLQNWPQFYRVIASCPPEKNLASCIQPSCAVQVR
jgi:hypothetical protein